MKCLLHFGITSMRDDTSALPDGSHHLPLKELFLARLLDECALGPVIGMLLSGEE